MLLVHRRHIVEPVEIGQRLQIVLVFDQLLGAAVEQTDMRIGAVDDLAIQFQHQPEHAMRRRVLRPEIEGEAADGGFDHGGPSAESVCFSGCRPVCGHSCVRAPIMSSSG